MNINGIEIPEPIREAPEIGTEFWVACTHPNIVDYKHTWTGSRQFYPLLSLGIMHATKEAAQLHKEALLSLSAR